MRTPDWSGSPPNPWNLALLSILQNLEVEALVEATLTLFILPFTEWSRGVFIGAGGWRCGRNWCQGGTLGKPANHTHVRSATAFGQTAIVSSDSLSLGL
jgi:hypothetical protein